jgi:hydrogenase maturation protein HypF
VARLRERKQREEKPLALMFANNASLAAYVFMTHAEAAQLEAPERPIVLLQKQASCNRAFPGIAPGVVWLGAMLPYTPLTSTTLAGIADAYLLHDREIVTRCDDSVLRVLPGTQSPQFIRRARGFTPRAIKLARCGADVLALGGVFNNTLCFTRRERAFVSPHIGDLDHVAACLALEDVRWHGQPYARRDGSPCLC